MIAAISMGQGQRLPARAIAAVWTLVLTLALHPALAARVEAAATLTGRVVDESGGVVAHADIALIDLATGLERKTETTERGEFVLLGLPPGRYQLTAQRDGFAPLQVPDLQIHESDEATLLLTLKITPISELVIIKASQVRVSTSPAVSTVVDRPLASRLPLNAGSVQSLIWLVPGMVRTYGSGYGQFSANGQRDNANYLTIDGASANLSAGRPLPAGGGGVPATSRLGTTNNLISIDALESVRVQTSSYTAELGRTPGAQIAITSRAGTNQVHGAAFAYLRHDALDASDWFANAADLEKPELRHHQFGGVLGGPLAKDRVFFFASYEGLRVRQPTTIVTSVPSLRVREAAAPALRPLLDAFPRPARDLGTGVATPYTASFSTPGRLDATSVRLDHLAGPAARMFVRYNQSPSEITLANEANAAASNVYIDRTRTITSGLTVGLSPRLHNDLRLNYSSNARIESGQIEARHGASPLRRSDVLSTPRSRFSALFFNGPSSITLLDERGTRSQQINVVDTLTAIAGDHQIKLGIDIRHQTLWPTNEDYSQSLIFDTEADIVNGVATTAVLWARAAPAPVVRNYSAYAQDTWRISPRSTLTMGVRWEANPAPSDRDGRRPFVARDLDDSSKARVELLPEGEPLYRTRPWNFAPRVGASHQLAERADGWETVLRGGAGLFYDLGSGSTLWAFDANPPFVSSVLRFQVPYPLSPADAAAPPPGPESASPTTVVAVDPDLRLPYTWHWNAAVEQALGQAQTLTVTYVGAAGRRLLQRRHSEPLPATPALIGSRITSDGASAYRALQVRLQRRLSHGVAALASYSWARAQDAQSDDLNVYLLEGQDLWGAADFDVRHSATAAVTYDVPRPRRAMLARLVGDWGIDGMLRASSAYPFTPRGPQRVLDDGTPVSTLLDGVSGAPIWIADPAAAGGRRLNPDAFTLPEGRQPGNVGRNRLRGFPFSQVDVAIRRTFRLREELRLSIRADAFNVLNHPNFLNPSASDRLGSVNFGRATQMANRGFGGVQGPALQQFYESGGPRSMQLSLRLEF
jgi:hypothetical protein